MKFLRCFFFCLAYIYSAITWGLLYQQPIISADGETIDPIPKHESVDDPAIYVHRFPVRLRSILGEHGAWLNLTWAGLAI